MANEKSMVEKIIPSPCIGNCCLDQQDICLGCARHIDEIVGWHGSNNNQRLQILKACQQRKTASQEKLKLK